MPGPVDFAGGRVVSPPIMTGWDRFDIRGFHDVVLGNGPLPLSVLAEAVGDWVATLS